MSSPSFSGKENAPAYKESIPRNYELWDSALPGSDSSRELEFHSSRGNVKIRLKGLYRDLVPDDYREAL